MTEWRPLTIREGIVLYARDGWTDDEIVASYPPAAALVLDDTVYHLNAPPERRRFAAAVAAIAQAARGPGRPGRRRGTTTIGKAKLIAAYWAEYEAPTTTRVNQLATPAKERVAGRLGRDRRTLDNALVVYGLDWENMPRE